MAFQWVLGPQEVQKAGAECQIELKGLLLLPLRGNDGPLAISGGGDRGPRRPRSRSPPRLYGRNRARSPRGRSPERRRPSPPRRKRSPPGEAPRANFPSRNDPKSPSPRRLAREMGGRRSRSRSYPRERRREERASEFSGGVEELAIPDFACQVAKICEYRLLNGSICYMKGAWVGLEGGNRMQ